MYERYTGVIIGLLLLYIAYLSLIAYFVSLSQHSPRTPFLNLPHVYRKSVLLGYTGKRLTSCLVWERIQIGSGHDCDVASPTHFDLDSNRVILELAAGYRMTVSVLILRHMISSEGSEL